MKIKTDQLEFISWINRDGSGTKKVPKDMLDNLQLNPLHEALEINSLSISEGTYIASGFNSYVVKLKV